MKPRGPFCVSLSVLLLGAASLLAQEAKPRLSAPGAAVVNPDPAGGRAQAVVPRFIKFSGTLEDMAAKPIVSVPYALKAQDAETLGGKPASAFMLAANCSGDVSSPSCQATGGSPASPAAPGAATANLAGTKGKTGLKPLSVPISTATNFTDSTTNQVVFITQSGTGYGLRVAAPMNTAILSQATGTTG